MVHQGKLLLQFIIRVELDMGRDGNGAGSGQVAPIPTPPRLFETILIPVPFKKLNGTGWDERAGMINSHTHLI